MKKISTLFRCQECGYSSAKWLGKCPDCNQWNTFVEEVIRETKRTRHQPAGTKLSSPLMLLDDVTVTQVDRYPTYIPEFDRILGGGIVPGSLTLIAGPPGIGKSTLLLQVAGKVAASNKVLYVSGEESVHQIKLRAVRLGLNKEQVKNVSNFYVIAETDLDTILTAVDNIKPSFLVIDSIQTLYSSNYISAPGSVSQIRGCTTELVNLSKSTGIATFILGHITKEGTLAGPRVLEHLVDTVLYFDSEKMNVYRILRAFKNRFGATNEVGVFQMKPEGLLEVPNPSNLFLQERNLNTSGSVVVSTVEGTRALLLELQALVSPTNFPAPRRMVNGLDYNRVILLIAVLEKRLGYHLGTADVFVNIVGGMKVKETAVDLGAVCALSSAWLDFVCPQDTVFCGEVGLAGEVRSVGYIEERIAEAVRMGFKRCLLPHRLVNMLVNKYNIELIGINHVKEAVDFLRLKKN